MEIIPSPVLFEFLRIELLVFDKLMQVAVIP
jgi:hypothetical protein